MYGADWEENPWDEDATKPWSTLIYAPDLLPTLSFTPMNLSIQPGGTILAMPGFSATERSEVLIQGAWKPSAIYGQALDIATDGTAIGRNHNGLKAPICLNGKWTDIERYAPVEPNILAPPFPWYHSTVNLWDTTPSGWILAQKYLNDIEQFSVMLPLRLDGVNNTTSPANLEDHAAGVDRISMEAHSGTGRVPEIWIMAPVGGSNTVRFRAPLNTVSNLKLESDKVTFTPAVMNAADQQIQVAGNASVTATEDVQPVLKLGGILDSLSVPLKIKVMKKRVVKVALHKVQGLGDNSIQTNPQYMPTEAQLEEYLNHVYGRQVNTTFDVTLFLETGPNRPNPEEEGIDFDLDNDHKVIIYGNSPELIAATPNAKSQGTNATANIDVWVIGGDMKLYTRNMFGRDTRAAGISYGGNSANKAIIDGSMIDFPQVKDAEKPNFLLHTIAHEIGHMLTAAGHPDDTEPNGAVVLEWDDKGAKDPYLRKRLMRSGENGGYTERGTCLLKKEWDLIEVWLEANIKDTN